MSLNENVEYKFQPSLPANYNYVRFFETFVFRSQIKIHDTPYITMDRTGNRALTVVRRMPEKSTVYSKEYWLLFNIDLEPYPRAIPSEMWELAFTDPSTGDLELNQELEMFRDNSNPKTDQELAREGEPDLNQDSG